MNADLVVKNGKCYELTEHGQKIGSYAARDAHRWPVWPAKTLCIELSRLGHDVGEPNQDVLNAHDLKPQEQAQPPQKAEVTHTAPDHDYKREAQALADRIHELIHALRIDKNNPAVTSWVRGVGYVDEVLSQSPLLNPRN
jgi:hypothetical protein